MSVRWDHRNRFPGEWDEHLDLIRTRCCRLRCARMSLSVGCAAGAEPWQLGRRDPRSSQQMALTSALHPGIRVLRGPKESQSKGLSAAQYERSTIYQE